jgi:hypothetical protein
VTAATTRYRDELAARFFGADMLTYARAPGFLENPSLYHDVGLLVADVLHGTFNLDTTPHTHPCPQSLLPTGPVVRACGRRPPTRQPSEVAVQLIVGAVPATVPPPDCRMCWPSL